MMKMLLISLMVASLLTRNTLSQEYSPSFQNTGSSDTFASQNMFECGVSQTVNKLIVNGYSTKRGVWPWHVAIYHKHGRNNEKYACGGTLVTKLHVITAAHCLKDIDNKQPLSKHNISVRLGVHQLHSKREEIQLRTVGNIHRIGTFPGQDLRDDIAILELTTEAKFGEYVQPACVSLKKNLTGQLGTVFGWGADETGQVSDKLKSARLMVIDYYKCVKSEPMTFGAKLDHGMFCAGYTNGTTVCNGDSGGGILFEENGVWHLGGIVSFSQMRDDGSSLCDIDGYGAFTKIHTYLAWIKTVTKLQFHIDEGQCMPREFDANINYSNVLPRGCGRSHIRRVPQRGTANLMEFPWMAILRYENVTKMNESCVGTLIHKRYVLTHASCTLTGLSHVRLGEHRIGQVRDCDGIECAPPVKDYGVECVIRHPTVTTVNAFRKKLTVMYMDVRKMTNDLVSNNVGLIRLDQDVIFEKHIRPVCLPVTQQLRNMAPPQSLVTGWSISTSLFSASTLLKETVVTNPEGCTEFELDLRAKVDNLFCVIESDRLRVCRVSAGSPFGRYVQLDRERFVQFGISFSGAVYLKCNLTYAINVGKLMDWILPNIQP